MNRRKQGVLVVLTVFMSCLLVAYLAVITTHHNGLTLFARHHESWHSGDNDSWSGSGTQSELYPTPVFNPTCQALEQLAATSGTCTTSDQCTGLNCVVIGIGSVDFRIEPCHNPPAVHVVGKDASGIVIVNETLTKSRQESVGLGTLNINIMQSPNEDSISISVTASVVAGIAPVTIIPETTIPLNRAQCPHAVTPTQPTTTHTFTPLRMPSPTPRVSETCDSLQQLASSSQLCVTNVQCSGLHCELPGGVTGSFDVTVEPCHNPPAVNVVQRNALGEVIYNETLTKSRKENFGLGTLNINLMQSPNEDSISINVTVSVVAGTAPVTIIPETTIPLNRAQCPRAVTPTQPTTTRTFTPLRMPSPTPRASETCESLQQLASSSQSSSRPPMGTFYTAVIVTTTRNTSTMVSPSKLPSGSSQSITIAVAVPVTILLVSIGGIVMLVAIVMAIRRHKRVRREYHFQRMTFNTDNDDDDDDNDL